MKIINLTLLVTLLSSCSLFQKSEDVIEVVHWNIKELDTQKLAEDNEQLEAVKNILDEYNFDLLSINELQYDKKGIPDQFYSSEGKNAEKLLTKLDKETMDYAISFHQANTGNKAKKNSKGKYLTKMNRQARKLADQDNFGIFPGQYSTALISRFPIKHEVVIKDLKWREFNRKIDLSKYKRPNGRRIPTGLELFDKTFNDTIIEVNGQEVHIITLHTVPSYHFGNKKSPNYKRNSDQLRFLEWYLTGGTDIPVQLPERYKNIKPLPPTAKFIALGDWNTSIYENNEGSQVLRRLFKQVKLWIERPAHTHETQHFGKKRLKLTLDYIAYRGLNILDAGIHYPKEDSGTCITYESLSKKLKSRSEKIDPKKCINEESVELKMASDHFPIWAKFKL